MQSQSFPDEHPSRRELPGSSSDSSTRGTSIQFPDRVDEASALFEQSTHTSAWKLISWCFDQENKLKPDYQSILVGQLETAQRLIEAPRQAEVPILLSLNKDDLETAILEKLLMLERAALNYVPENIRIDVTLELQNQVKSRAEALSIEALGIFHQNLAHHFLRFSARELLLMAYESLSSESEKDSFLASARSNQRDQKAVEALFLEVAKRTLRACYFPAHRAELNELHDQLVRRTVNQVVGDLYGPQGNALGFITLQIAQAVTHSRNSISEPPVPSSSLVRALPQTDTVSASSHRRGRSQPRMPVERASEPSQDDWLQPPPDITGALLLSFLSDPQSKLPLPAIAWGITASLLLAERSVEPLLQAAIPFFSVTEFHNTFLASTVACYATVEAFLRRIPTGSEDNSVWPAVLTSRLVSSSILSNMLLVSDSLLGFNRITTSADVLAVNILAFGLYFFYETQMRKGNSQ